MSLRGFCLSCTFVHRQQTRESRIQWKSFNTNALTYIPLLRPNGELWALQNMKRNAMRGVEPSSFYCSEAFILYSLSSNYYYFLIQGRSLRFRAVGVGLSSTEYQNMLLWLFGTHNHFLVGSFINLHREGLYRDRSRRRRRPIQSAFHSIGPPARYKLLLLFITLSDRRIMLTIDRLRNRFAREEKKDGGQCLSQRHTTHRHTVQPIIHYGIFSLSLSSVFQFYLSNTKIGRKPIIYYCR